MPADLTWIPASLEPPPACVKSYYDDLHAHKTDVVATWLAGKFVVRSCSACGVSIMWCYQHAAHPIPVAWARPGYRGPGAHRLCGTCERRRWNCLCARPEVGDRLAPICGGSF